MANWTFLTPHGRVLLLVAHDPGVRLRDIAASRTHVADSSAIAVQVTRGADMAAAPRNVGAPAGSAGHSLPG